jgi:hypothetical protein
MWIPKPAALHGLVLVAAHPKLWSFVRFCAWSILLPGPKPHLRTIRCLYSALQQICSKLVPQVKTLFLFVTACKDLYVSWALF